MGVWSAREKSLEILRRGWELNPGHGEDRQWAIPLTYHDPGHREGRQWAIPLSYHDWRALSLPSTIFSRAVTVLTTSSSMEIFWWKRSPTFPDVHLIATNQITISQQESRRRVSGRRLRQEEPISEAHGRKNQSVRHMAGRTNQWGTRQSESAQTRFYAPFISTKFPKLV